jgi:5-methyltetrahydrofolate--homocysteine methyltransferase
MLIIGESLNGTLTTVGQAILKRDAEFVVQLARCQVEAGAHMLDVNAGVAGGNEVEDLPWLVSTVLAKVDIPLSLDSADPEAIRAALKLCRGRPVINSITGEQSRLEGLLPLVVEYDCGVVILCMDERGIPETAQDRFEVGRSLVERATQAGVKADDIYMDPLVMSLGVDWRAPTVTLATLRLIREHIPEVHIVSGMSNVSFGLPKRHLLNCTFLAMLVAAGLDTFLIDARDKGLMASLWAAQALSGSDRYCAAYLKAYRAGQLEV